MAVEYRPCDACLAGIHDHKGTCMRQGVVVIQSYGGPIEKTAACQCEKETTRVVVEVDTQQEVSFAG